MLNSLFRIRDPVPFWPWTQDEKIGIRETSRIPNTAASISFLFCVKAPGSGGRVQHPVRAEPRVRGILHHRGECPPLPQLRACQQGMVLRSWNALKLPVRTHLQWCSSPEMPSTYLKEHTNQKIGMGGGRGGRGRVISNLSSWKCARTYGSKESCTRRSHRVSGLVKGKYDGKYVGDRKRWKCCWKLEERTKNSNNMPIFLQICSSILCHFSSSHCYFMPLALSSLAVLFIFIVLDYLVFLSLSQNSSFIGFF